MRDVPQVTPSCLRLRQRSAPLAAKEGHLYNAVAAAGVRRPRLANDVGVGLTAADPTKVVADASRPSALRLPQRGGLGAGRWRVSGVSEHDSIGFEHAPQSGLSERLREMGRFRVRRHDGGHVSGVTSCVMAGLRGSCRGWRCSAFPDEAGKNFRRPCGARWPSFVLAAAVLLTFRSSDLSPMWPDAPPLIHPTWVVPTFALLHCSAGSAVQGRGSLLQCFRHGGNAWADSHELSGDQAGDASGLPRFPGVRNNRTARLAGAPRSENAPRQPLRGSERGRASRGPQRTRNEGARADRRIATQ